MRSVHSLEVAVPDRESEHRAVGERPDPGPGLLVRESRCGRQGGADRPCVRDAEDALAGMPPAEAGAAGTGTGAGSGAAGMTPAAEAGALAAGAARSSTLPPSVGERPATLLDM